MAGVFDDDVVSEQAHPDVFAHEIWGHDIAVCAQGDGGVSAHQAADLHLQELSQFSRGRATGGMVSLSVRIASGSPACSRIAASAPSTVGSFLSLIQTPPRQ